MRKSSEKTVNFQGLRLQPALSDRNNGENYPGEPPASGQVGILQNRIDLADLPPAMVPDMVFSLEPQTSPKELS